jgi:hypothetical protein
MESSNAAPALLTAIMMAFGSMYVFIMFTYALVFAVAIASYVLLGIAILNMSNARGLPNGWLGFVPLANMYQLGQISGDIEIAGFKVKHTGIWLAIAPLLMNVVSSFLAMFLMLPFMLSMIPLAESTSPDAFIAPMVLSIGSIVAVILLVAVVQLFWYFFLYSVYHRIYLQYVGRQKALLYVVLSIFVPLALQIIMFKLSKEPILETAVTEKSWEETEHADETALEPDAGADQ